MQNLTDKDTGIYSCIGRPLALLNLRTTLAKILQAFDGNSSISFAEGEDGTAFECQARTQFTLAPGPLRLVFERRIVGEEVRAEDYI